MSLSFWLILIPTICYGMAAMAYGFARNWPLAIVYWHYMGANVGLLWLDRILSKRG